LSTTALALTAATWGIVMALAPVLQIRRILRLRSSRDISLGYLGVLTVGFLLWIAYGLALENAALVVPNTIAFCVGMATIAIALRFRSGPGRAGGSG
jgi:MtN3 and saliva related transmembrane protein